MGSKNGIIGSSLLSLGLGSSTLTSEGTSCVTFGQAIVERTLGSHRPSFADAKNRPGKVRAAAFQRQPGTEGFTMVQTVKERGAGCRSVDARALDEVLALEAGTYLGVYATPL